MAISRIGVGTRAEAATGNLTTSALPVGWAPGDLAILTFVKRGSAGTADLPATWTEIPDDNPGSTGGGTMAAIVGWRKLETGDTTWTITDDGENGKSAIIVVYRGQDQTTPIDVVAAWNATTTAADPVAINGDDITIATAGAALIFVGFMSDDYGTAFSAASGMDEVYDFETTTGTDHSGFLDEQLGMGTGATGTRTKNGDPTGTAKALGLTFAIRPATAATHSAAAALAGVGSAVIAAIRSTFSVAALTGTGSSATAGVRTTFATAALTGTGSSTSTGVRETFATAALSGNGTLTTDGTRVRFGLTDLTGTGSLTAEGTVTPAAAPADPFTRGAEIFGRRVRRVPDLITASAALTGVGWLEATGHVTHAPPPPSPERVLEQVGVESRTLIDLSHEDDLIVALLLA